MEEALHLLRAYEAWIYLILGTAGLWYGRKLWLARQAMHEAVFGVEREAARARAQRAALMLALLLMLAVAEFSLVSFIFPAAANALPLPEAPTTTSLAAPQATLAPPTATPLPTVPFDASGCVPGQVDITAPQDNDTVSGTVEVQGTADIPNFGFYKYEMARPGAALWLTIGAARKPVREGLLGLWDTSTLPPGEYILRLVVTDTNGDEQPPCMRSVYVTLPETP